MQREVTNKTPRSLHRVQLLAYRPKVLEVMVMQAFYLAEALLKIFWVWYVMALQLQKHKKTSRKLSLEHSAAPQKTQNKQDFPHQCALRRKGVTLLLNYIRRICEINPLPICLPSVKSVRQHRLISHTL